MPSRTIPGIQPDLDRQRRHHRHTRESCATATNIALLLRLRSGIVLFSALVDHSEFELEKVGLGTASRLCALPISLVESLAALVQGVDDVLALVLLERIPFEAICNDSAVMLDVEFVRVHTLNCALAATALAIGVAKRQKERHGRRQRTARGWHGGFD